MNSLRNIVKSSTLSLLLPLALVNCKENNKEEISHPNILFVIADDISFPHMGAYGTDWIKTPAFDQVAQSGILFTNAYTPNAKSAPSRACILTGRNSWQLEEAGNHIGFWPENKYATFCETFSENGYFVGYTGKGWAPGDPGKINGHKRQLIGKPFQKRELIPPTNGINKVDYFSNFADFINENSNENPWFFWYGGHEPHRAYEFKSGENVGGKEIRAINKVPKFWPDNDSVRNDMLDYALEIEYFDSHLIKMIKLLEERGELNNTIIVVTSDNGMPFPRIKGMGYEYSVHLPLAIMWPEGIKNPGRKESSYISMIDFAPTFLKAAGIDWSESKMADVSGKDFIDILHDKPEHGKRDHIILGQERHDYGRPKNQGYPIRSIIKDGFLFMMNFKHELWPAGDPITGYLNTDGSPTKTNILNMNRNGVDKHYWEECFGKNPEEELYKISSDPECLINLVELKEYREIKGYLKVKLLEELKKQSDPRLLGQGDVFDHYPFMDKKMRNFYERYINGEIEEYQTWWVEPSDYENKHLENNK